MLSNDEFNAVVNEVLRLLSLKRAWPTIVPQQAGNNLRDASTSISRNTGEENESMVIETGGTYRPDLSNIESYLRSVVLLDFDIEITERIDSYYPNKLYKVLIKFGKTKLNLDSGKHLVNK